MTITEAQEKIKTGRDKTSKPIQNNTRLEARDGGKYAIKLHATDVVTLLPNGNAILNSGGWLTVTTKERINSYTNARISQKNGIWYMVDGSLFYDGMTIKPNGLPVKPKRPETTEKQVNKYKKMARKYAKDYVKALKAGEVDFPNGGDCCACLMRGPKGQEAFEGSGHILQHIEESYFVPSLLVNAGRSAGYGDHQIGLMGIGGQRLFIDPENNIYKYVVKQLRGIK